MAGRKKRGADPTERIERALAPAPAVADDEDSPIADRRGMLRRAEVGYYMALFPGVGPGAVCEKFNIHRNTLRLWYHDDVFLAGFERGIKARQTEQDEAARQFFKSRVMSYVERIDEIAMQTVDKRTALQALLRILESQGTLEQQKASIVNVAIQLQRGLEAATAPAIYINGEEVSKHNGKSESEGQGGGSESPEGRHSLPSGEHGNET